MVYLAKVSQRASSGEQVRCGIQGRVAGIIVGFGRGAYSVLILRAALASLFRILVQHGLMVGQSRTKQWLPTLH